MSNASSATRSHGSTGQTIDSWMHAFEEALSVPEPTPRGWRGAGVGRRTERVLNVLGGALLLMFAIGWGWSMANARTVNDHGVLVSSARTTSTIATALTKLDA